MMPGQLGPISRVLLCCIMARFTLTMSCCGMPSVMHTTRSSSASTATMIADCPSCATTGWQGVSTTAGPVKARPDGPAKGGGTYMTLAFAPVPALASATVSAGRERYMAAAARSTAQRTQVCAAALLGRHATHHFRAIGDGLRAVGSELETARQRERPSRASDRACSEWKVPFFPVKPWQMTCTADRRGGSTRSSTAAASEL